MLDGRQLGDADPEQLPPGSHEGPEPGVEGEVPEKPVGGHPIVHLEVGPRQHVPRQELAGIEDGWGLKWRLRDGGGYADRETHRFLLYEIDVHELMSNLTLNGTAGSHSLDATGQPACLLLIACAGKVRPAQ
jgi:hypothetical protein